MLDESHSKHRLLILLIEMRRWQRDIISPRALLEEQRTCPCHTCKWIVSAALTSAKKPSNVHPTLVARTYRGATPAVASIPSTHTDVSRGSHSVTLR
jgi:hypothetical protein